MGRYLPHLVLMFLGGLTSSLGPSLWARSPRGRALLERTSSLMLGVATIGALGVMGLAGWWLVRGLLDQGGEAVFASPWPLLLFGLAVGLPMGLPQIIAVWNEERPAKKAEREKKAAEATAQDREAYAAELLEQIRTASPDPRKLEAFIRGDDRRVLWFEGDLARDEGERLVAALRRDLQEHGFRRVEGRGSKGNWRTDV